MWHKYYLSSRTHLLMVFIAIYFRYFHFKNTSIARAIQGFLKSNYRKYLNSKISPIIMSYYLYIKLFIILLFFCFSAAAKTDKYRCMWRENPATTMVIGWNQLSGSSPVLYYDTADKGQNAQAYAHAQAPNRSISFQGMNNQFVRLTNLQPNTTYYFIIKDSEGLSTRMSFQTAPDSPYQKLSIIAGGDSRNHREARKNANKLVGKLSPHCVLFGGDMTASDSPKEWQAWLDDWQYTITKEGRLTPIVPARGNHEASNKTLVNLFDVKFEDIYYALTLGGNLLRIYTLNSMIASGGGTKELASKRPIRQQASHVENGSIPP